MAGKQWEMALRWDLNCFLWSKGKVGMAGPQLRYWCQKFLKGHRHRKKLEQREPQAAEGEWGLAAHRNRVSRLRWRKCSGICGDRCTTKLYILRGCILCYVTYISIKKRKSQRGIQAPQYGLLVTENKWGDARVAQSVKCLTLDFGSGHDLTVCEFEPCIGLCVDSLEPA